MLFFIRGLLNFIRGWPRLRTVARVATAPEGEYPAPLVHMARDILETERQYRSLFYHPIRLEIEGPDLLLRAKEAANWFEHGLEYFKATGEMPYEGYFFESGNVCHLYQSPPRWRSEPGPNLGQRPPMLDFICGPILWCVDFIRGFRRVRALQRVATAPEGEYPAELVHMARSILENWRQYRSLADDVRLEAEGRLMLLQSQDSVKFFEHGLAHFKATGELPWPSWR